MNTTGGSRISSGDELYALFQASLAARRRFYLVADGRWLGWLWKNGFLDVLKEGGMSVPDDEPDPPELGYLSRMAPEDPKLVADIIRGIPVTETGFTARMVENLLWVSSRLPAGELARVIPKVSDEGWVGILARHGHRKFGHHGIITELHTAGNHEELLTLAEALLALRPMAELAQPPFDDQGPLHFSDLSCGGLFRCLADIGDSHVERALSLVLRTLGGIVERRGIRGVGAAFELFDNLFLPDVDLFSVRMDGSRVTSPDNDAHKLAAALRQLAERHIRLSRADSKRIRKFHAENVAPLPDSWAMWRVRLFFSGSVPDILKADFREALFKIFAHEECRALVTDAEYLHALGRGFQTLSGSDQRRFVRQLCELTQSGQHPALVGDALSVIHRHLTPGELNAANRLGITVDPCFKPESPAERMNREPRLPRHPMNRDELEHFPVPTIAEQLKASWSPVELGKSGDGTWRTPGTEGVGDMLAHDMRKRPDVYAAHAGLFFDRDRLDPHHTYVCLEEVRRAIREKPDLRARMDGKVIVDCCLGIVASNKADPFGHVRRTDKDGFAAWLGSWQSVLCAVARIVREMLYGTDSPVLPDVMARRDQIVEIVAHLLSAPDPMLQDGSGDAAWEDPFGLAINSTRGTAFEALVLLAHWEAQSRESEGKGKLAGDIRRLFEDTLANTTTAAIMSMYGRYFVALRSLDESWGTGLLGDIFPEEPPRQGLFGAAWTGYLLCTPPVQIQSDPRIHDLYKRGTRLSSAVAPDAKRFRYLVERLAYHLARFFVGSPEFGPGHPVLDFFWDQGTPKLRAGFVREVGEMAFTGGTGLGDSLSRKLLRFWDTAIREQQPKDVLVEFGHWVNARSPVIGIADLAGLVRRTLVATGGELSRPTELELSIVALAGRAPTDTLEIARAHLSWGGAQGNGALPPLDARSHWHQAIRILSETPSLKEEVRSLVGDLLATGNPEFESLMEALPRDLPLGVRPRPAQVRGVTSRASKHVPA